MNVKMNEYLEKIDKCLKPMPVSERVDIVKEIKSEIAELQTAGGMSDEEIMERLGAPGELAKAYLGKSISNSASFSWQKVGSLVAFYSLAGVKGLFVLPIISVMSFGLILSGIMALAAVVIKFVGLLIGADVSKFVILQFGSYTAPHIIALPVCMLFGILLLWGGRALWKLTIKCVRSFSRS